MTSMPDKPGLYSPDFLVFSDDWGEHPSSCQHIFKEIAKDYRVVWVNTIGMRNPTLTLRDLKKAAKKILKMVRLNRCKRRAATQLENIAICQPLMLPFTRSRFARRFNRWSVTRRVVSELKSRTINEPIIVTTVPNAAEYPKLLRSGSTIYYCVDDFFRWPGLDSMRVNEMEEDLIGYADVIIAASDSLAKKFESSNLPVYILTHGVDVEHFQNLNTTEHLKLLTINRPRIGFFGLVDDRMDWALIDAIARDAKGISFVFAGKVDATAGRLPKRQNIHFLGNVEYSELPSFIVGMEVLMIPYKTTGIGEMIAPLKLKEYLCTGKPVLVTPFSEMRRYAPPVRIAKTPEEWSEALNAVLNQLNCEEHRQITSDLKSESWCEKAKAFIEIAMNVRERQPRA